MTVEIKEWGWNEKSSLSVLARGFYSSPTAFNAKTQYKVHFVEIQGQLITANIPKTLPEINISWYIYRNYNPNGLHGLLKVSGIFQLLLHQLPLGEREIDPEIY